MNSHHFLSLHIMIWYKCGLEHWQRRRGLSLLECVKVAWSLHISQREWACPDPLFQQFSQSGRSQDAWQLKTRTSTSQAQWLCVANLGLWLHSKSMSNTSNTGCEVSYLWKYHATLHPTTWLWKPHCSLETIAQSSIHCQQVSICSQILTLVRTGLVQSHLDRWVFFWAWKKFSTNSNTA